MGTNQNTARVAAGELAQIDPTTVVIDTNVRTDAALDKAFAASIAERGVILPVVATRDTDGTVRVRDGQRRTLAAREAGLDTIPVYVIASDTAGDAATVERVTDQLIANEHRTDLTNSERAQAAQQLIDLGVSRTRVAKVTSLGSTKAVDAAVATAKSAVAMSSLDAGLTLEQAAIIAGYEDDADTDAVRMLCDAAAEGTFDHRAAQLAATATERAAHREAAAPIVAAGYELLERRPYYYGADAPKELVRLVHRETGEPVTDDQLDTLTRDRVVAYVDIDTTEVWTDSDGQPVDETLIDWSLHEDDDPASVPADGLLDPRILTEGESVTATVTRFVATTMWRHHDLFGIARSEANSRAIAAELIGSDPIEAQEQASAERAQVITAAIVIAAHEANFPKDAWRQAGEHMWADAKARAAYLAFLVEVFGYTLAEVEQAVAGAITAESIDLDS